MSMYNRKKALDQTQEDSPIILGNDMNTQVFNEGYTIDDFYINDDETEIWKNISKDLKQRALSHFSIIE